MYNVLGSGEIQIAQICAQLTSSSFQNFSGGRYFAQSIIKGEPFYGIKDNFSLQQKLDQALWELSSSAPLPPDFHHPPKSSSIPSSFSCLTNWLEAQQVGSWLDFKHHVLCTCPDTLGFPFFFYLNVPRFFDDTPEEEIVHAQAFPIAGLVPIFFFSKHIHDNCGNCLKYIYKNTSILIKEN